MEKDKNNSNLVLHDDEVEEDILYWEDDLDSEELDNSVVSNDNESYESIDLNYLARTLKNMYKQESDIRFYVFDNFLRQKIGKGYENYIFSYHEEDSEYHHLVCSMYSLSDGLINKIRVHDDSKRKELIKYLTEYVNKNSDLSTEDKAKTIDEEDNDDSIDYSLMKAIVNDIMKVYDQVYAPTFVNKPLGVLTEEGILSIDDKGNPFIIKNDVYSAKRLYSSIYEYTKGYISHFHINKDISADYFNKDGSLSKTYCPLYHAYNIFGWYEENGVMKQEHNWVAFRGRLEKTVIKRVKNVLNASNEKGIDIEKLEDSIKDLMTNVIVILEFDRTKVLSMVYRLGVSTEGYAKYLLSNQKSILKSEVGELVNSSYDVFKVGRLLYAYDIDNYNKEILFSYKLFDKMKKAKVKPTTTNVIIGRKLNGEDFGINFEAQNNIVTSIIAGSGSGKGVVTLNILAYLLACGSPVVYMDYKPDMSSTLWLLERELGVPILSVDAKENRHKFGITPTRLYPYGMNAPKGFDVEDSFWSIVPYLKMVQLACVVASIRSANAQFQGKKIFFIFDELQSLNAHVGEAIKVLEKFIKDNKKDESKAELVEYATKFIKVFKDNLKSAIMDLLKTTGRNGLVGCIVLGQSVNPDDWRFGDQTWKNSPLVTLMTDSNYRLAGAKHRSSKSSYSLDGLKYEGDKFISENRLGYFACHANFVPPSEGKGVTVVKSYLTLNANDVEQAVARDNIADVNPNTFVGGLLNNISDMGLRERIYKEDLLKSDGSVNERIGFAGLMKGIIKDLNNVSDNDALNILKENLSSSYYYIMKIFDYIGLSKRYSSVEEYLFDCAYDSIFTYGELKSGVFQENDALNIGHHENNVSHDVTEDWLNKDTNLSSYDTNNLSETEGVKTSSSIRNALEDEYISPNKVSNYKAVYDKEIYIPINPFNKGTRTGKSTLSTLKSLQIMSDYLLKEIENMFGDLGRITEFEVDNGGLVLNGIAFRPKLSEDIVESLPYDIKLQVENGNVVELFNFQNLYKFKSLRRLMINNIDLAESRVKTELGLGKGNWLLLYKKLPNLVELYIGGILVTEDGKYDTSVKEGYSLREKLIDKLGKRSFFQSSSLFKKVWNNRAIRITANALGWTVALKGATTIAFMLGGWGIVFGALFGYGTYKHFKKK